MTARTRRRLTVCLVLGLITLPAEALLLPVATTPDVSEAAVAWVGDRSADELAAAADNIENYPAIYRRAIMGALTPDERAAAWRGHFERYLASHPDLTGRQRQVIGEAMALLTAEAFQPPLSPDLQARVSKMFETATTELGGPVAAELFVTMGPKQALANALPLSQRLADRVRSWRVGNASAPDCNCNIDIDTCDVWPQEDWLQCSELYTCEFDLSWPMCGPLWSWACTGWCRVVIWPEMN